MGGCNCSEEKPLENPGSDPNMEKPMADKDLLPKPKVRVMRSEDVHKKEIAAMKEKLAANEEPSESLQHQAGSPITAHDRTKTWDKLEKLQVDMDALGT